jgi:uncharacterized protein (AIM24 family)
MADFARLPPPIPLARGDSVQVQAGQFLLCAGARGAVVWVQARGGVLERGLKEGESFDILQSAFLCKDLSVALQTVASVPVAESAVVASPGRSASGLRAVAGSLLGRIHG